MSVVEQERTEVVAPEVTKRDVLHRAADLIEEFGWCTGEVGSKQKGQFCLRGAIIQAHQDLFGKRLDDYCDPKVLDYESSFYEDHGGSWTWNDSLPQSKGKAIVVSALRSAAERAS